MITDPEIIKVSERLTLNLLLEEFIPSNSELGMPSAAELGLLDVMLSEIGTDWFLQGLQDLELESHSAFQEDFVKLSLEHRHSLVNKLMRNKFSFFQGLVKLLISKYYQNDEVLYLIGVEPRPPFPLGHITTDGAFSLLEPVYERGEIFRK